MSRKVILVMAVVGALVGLNAHRAPSEPLPPFYFKNSTGR